MREKIKSVIKANTTIIYTLLGLIVLVIVLSVASTYFLRGTNINNIFLQMSINGIVAIGLSCVIITGGIDLSVGSIVAVAGIVYGVVYKQAGESNVLTILATLLVGVIMGAINGVLIAKGKLPAFIATLGMMQIGRGLALLISGASPISGYSEFLVNLGGGFIFGISVPIIIMIFIYIIAYIVLKYTRLGRNLYAIGGNMESSRLSGINIDATLMSTYVISGFMSSIAAIILTGRLNTATPQAGMQYEMDAIASCVIGGASLSGGKGGVVGTFIGALIISVVRNGMNLLNVNSYLQQILLGVIIIGAVFIDAMQGRRS